MEIITWDISESWLKMNMNVDEQFRTLNFTSSGYAIMKGILYFRLNNKRKFPINSQNSHV